MKKGAARKRVNEIADKYKNNPRKGITELKKILKEGQEKNDTVLIGLAYNALAVKYYDLGKTDAVFSNALKAVAFLEKTEEYEGLSTACINLGYGYSEQENDQMALAIYNVTVSATEGTAENNNVAVSIFPNPTNGIVNVKGEGVLSIEVIDITGRVVMRQQGVESIDMSQLPKGVYAIRTLTEKGTSLQKVLKR